MRTKACRGRSSRCSGAGSTTVAVVIGCDVSNSTFAGTGRAVRIRIMLLSTSFTAACSAARGKYRSAANISDNRKPPTKRKYLKISIGPLSLPQLRRGKNGKNRQSFRECKLSKFKRLSIRRKSGSFCRESAAVGDDRNPAALRSWPSPTYHSVWRSSGFCRGRISEALDIEAKALMIKLWVS